jgi:hypothetical protein
VVTTVLRSPVPRQAARPRGVFRTDELRAVQIGGRPGFRLDVGLPSYRSLPLSCIERVELRVVGDSFPPDHLTLRLNERSYPLHELGGMRDVWWFVLDLAELHVSLPLDEGEHDVELTVVTVEPYISNGRFSFHNSERRRMRLAADAGEDLR